MSCPSRFLSAIPKRASPWLSSNFRADEPLWSSPQESVDAALCGETVFRCAEANPSRLRACRD